MRKLTSMLLCAVFLAAAAAWGGTAAISDLKDAWVKLNKMQAEYDGLAERYGSLSVFEKEKYETLRSDIYKQQSEIYNLQRELSKPGYRKEALDAFSDAGEDESVILADLFRGQGDRDVVEVFSKKLAYAKGKELKLKLLELLGGMQNANAIEDMARELRNSDMEIRRAAIRALAWMRNSAAVEEIVKCYDDAREYETRAECIRALNGSEEKSAVEMFKKAAEKDDSYVVREAAVNSLGYYKDERTIDFLGKLPSREEHQQVRRAVIYALERTDSKYAVKYVEMLLNDQDYGVRDAARSAWERMKKWR